MNNEMELIKQLTLAAVVIAIIFGLLYHLNAQERERLAQVQSGEVKLVCLMKDGERVIEPGMVTGLFDDTWLFKNGSAKRCRIER